MKHIYLLIAVLPSSTPPTERIPEVTAEKISTPTVQLLMSYFWVTEPNLTKFLQDVQK